jgi:hypothetical protein
MNEVLPHVSGTEGLQDDVYLIGTRAALPRLRDALSLALTPVATGVAEEGMTAEGERSAVRVIREDSPGLGHTWRHLLPTSMERMRDPSKDVSMPWDLWSEDRS